MAKLPEKVGKYKILSLIGKGGMGVVYAAEHPTLKRKIILKKLTIRDKEFRERFRLEADLMMDLRSDYIVDMYDHFREGSSYYIAMEFIEGITLEELISKTGPLEFSLFIYIMSCTAKALKYIHDRGIIHRDIKPSNIYISGTGDVKLGDFGIASSSSRDVKITDSGSAMGTPAYMAPEQFHDSSAVDKRADIFSFGVTLYESLSGRKPFPSENFTELKQEICRGRYKKITALNKHIPIALRWMITRSLFINPSLRPRDINSMEKYFQKELKKWGYQKPGEQLAALAQSEKKTKKGKLTEVVEKTEKKGRHIQFQYIVLPVILLLSVLFFYSGSLYKVLLPDSYGALNLSMIPASDDGRYVLYSEKSGEHEMIKSGSFNSSGNVSHYLKEGSYTLKIESGSNVIWRSIYVPCFRDSRGEKMDVTVLSSSLEQFPLEMEYTVRDRFSSRDLTTESKVEIMEDDQWITLTDNLSKELTTGRIYDLRVSSDGYSSRLYSLDIAYYQTSVTMDILLSPIPAELQIPPIDGKIFLNGKDEYFSLETLRFESLDNRGKENMVIRLLPGKYLISIESDGITGEENIFLDSEDHREIKGIKIQENGIKIELD